MIAAPISRDGDLGSQQPKSVRRSFPNVIDSEKAGDLSPAVRLWESGTHSELPSNLRSIRGRNNCSLCAVWRIHRAARRGETVLRGRKVHRNVNPRDFWVSTCGDVAVLAVGVTLIINRLGTLL